MLGLVNIIGREGLLARAATSLLSRETSPGLGCSDGVLGGELHSELRAADGEEIQGQTLEDQ